MKNTLKRILKDLLEYNVSVKYFEDEIKKINTSENTIDDFDDIILSKKQLVEVMKKNIDNKITANELTRWAELVEQRDGITYEKEYQDKIADVLFWLSTPEINWELTPQRIGEYISFLNDNEKKKESSVK